MKYQVMMRSRRTGRLRIYASAATFAEAREAGRVILDHPSSNDFTRVTIRNQYGQRYGMTKRWEGTTER